MSGINGVTPHSAIAHLAFAEDMVMALGHNAWGKAHSAKDAIKQWRVSAPVRLSRTVVDLHLYRVSARSYVDERGGICFPSGDSRPEFMMEVRVRV